MIRPYEIRQIIREGKHTGPTSGLAPGYIQTNLVILPSMFAKDFQIFCQKNPKPCPLLETTEPGVYELQKLALHVDIRTDLPKYRIYQKGQLLEEVTDIRRWWRNDLVSFFLGCSFSFEEALCKAHLPVRHIEEKKNVPMYISKIPCQPSEFFRGNMVVSMRPFKPDQIQRVREVTSPYSFSHGEPVHAGDPVDIGIDYLENPDFGEAVTLYPDEIPVFWACGVTSQLAILNSGIELAITHSPGCMFISDIQSQEWLQFMNYSV